MMLGADPDWNWLLHSGPPPPPLLFEETGCVAVVLSSFWFGRGCIYGGTEALVCVLCPVRSMSGSGLGSSTIGQVLKYFKYS